MTLDKNDPRLTAYVLGELDESERTEFERDLAESPEARDEIEGIKKLTGELTEAFAAEPNLGLDEARKQSIEKHATNHQQSNLKRKKKRYWPMALAASLLVAASAAVMVPSLKKARHSIGARELPQHNGSNPLYVQQQAQLRGSGVDASSSTAIQLSPQDRKRLEALGYLRSDSSDVSRQDNQWALAKESESAEVLFAEGHSAFNKSSGIQHVGFNKKQLIPRIKNRDGFTWLRDARTRQRAPEWEVFSKSEATSVTLDRDIAESNTERYQPIFENPFQLVKQYPLSTFSIDVDTAAYSNLRRFINGGSLPPPNAVRIEEMINYFDYAYPQPTDDRPFSVSIDVVDCPWNTANLLARIGLKGVEVAAADRPPSNLVFLIDVSGSMRPANKLPLVKQALKLLVEQLDELDRVAIVVYAGASGTVLDSTTCDQQRLILDSLDRLQSGGSTNGGAGIELAYSIATENFIDGGTNRVILCTDGDFNVGVTDQGSLIRLIKEKAESGVFLSALGFGMGNLNDATLESLADNGNGNYAYIDTWAEARKVLVEELTGTLVTIAKDVKIQIEFNPAQAAAYRLIGYENRMLAAEDFNDDTKDAGEIGAGHTVTALYEIVPAGEAVGSPAVDPLKYQSEKAPIAQASSDELMTVKLRYKLPDGDTSQLIEQAVIDQGLTMDDMSDDMRFAAGVASFGMLLRHSNHVGDATYESVLGLVEYGLGDDAGGYRFEFVQLVRAAADIDANR